MAASLARMRDEGVRRKAEGNNGGVEVAVDRRRSVGFHLKLSVCNDSGGIKRLIKQNKPDGSCSGKATTKPI